MREARRAAYRGGAGVDDEALLPDDGDDEDPVEPDRRAGDGAGGEQRRGRREPRGDDARREHRHEAGDLGRPVPAQPEAPPGSAQPGPCPARTAVHVVPLERRERDVAAVIPAGGYRWWCVTRGRRRPERRWARRSPTCQGRAPSAVSTAAIPVSLRSAGGVHSRRRSTSGVSRFSTGTECSVPKASELLARLGEPRGGHGVAFGPRPGGRRAGTGQGERGQRALRKALRPADGVEPDLGVAPSRAQLADLVQLLDRRGSEVRELDDDAVRQDPAGGGVAPFRDPVAGESTAP